jgi:hypothetical protein
MTWWECAKAAGGTFTSDLALYTTENKLKMLREKSIHYCLCSCVEQEKRQPGLKVKQIVAATA